MGNKFKRRDFLKAGLATGAAAVLPGVVSANDTDKKKKLYLL
jgi:hypothetical protein